MSEKYSTNINSIENSIKKLKKFCDYEDSVVLIDNALIEIQDAIEIVLGNLEALADMQKSADKELENAKKINEEHRKENADLMKAINVVEKEKGEWIEDCNNLKKKVKELEEYIFVAPNLDEMTAIKYTNIQREAYFRGRAEEQQKAEQIIYENYISKQVIKNYLKEEKERFEIYKKESETNENLKLGMYKHLGAKNMCEKILGIEKIVTLD